ncbi:MAG: hypothetical protein IKA36_05755, partial [Clostridia bacterium]|nr:hypothetical protein [Clostridia bacterium]
NESVVTPEQPIYIGIDGSMFTSYKKALFNNTSIINQNVVFSYNVGQHKSIHDYNTIDNPNNVDIEPDILESITFDNDNDYNKLNDIPTINGVSLYHLTTESLGISEIPVDKVLDEFDKVWKREMLTNPLFTNNHKSYITKHEPSFRITKDDSITITITGNYDKYFTLFISNNESDNIDDVDNVVKVIPFVRTGIQIIIDNSYSDMWLKSTVNDKAIKI